MGTVLVVTRIWPGSYRSAVLRAGHHHRPAALREEFAAFHHAVRQGGPLPVGMRAAAERSPGWRLFEPARCGVAGGAAGDGVRQCGQAGRDYLASEERPPRDGEAGRGRWEPGMPAFRYLVVPRRLPAREQAATTARSGTVRSPCTPRHGISAKCGVSASGRRRRSSGRWPLCPATRTSPGAGQLSAARPSARR